MLEKMRLIHCMISVFAFNRLCFDIPYPVQAYDPGKLGLLRQRIQRLEARLAEDIAFIREEFYLELNEVSGKASEKDNGETRRHIGETSSEVEGIKGKLEVLDKYLSKKLKALRKGLADEKRFRRGIQDEIQLIKTEDSELVKAISVLTQNTSAIFENVLQNYDPKEQILEIISLLKDFKSSIAVSNTKSPQLNKGSESAADCADLFRSGHVTSGIYTVLPETMWRPLKVFCDMETDGGGWTVFQRRKDGSENFSRKWIDYSFGFGNLSREFWLGNEFVHRMTKNVPHELRVELEDFENDHRVAHYGLFTIGNADENYKLFVNFFEGNVTDSITATHSGQGFSTTDHGPSTDCSKSYKGGWWYKACHGVNINGLYLRGQTESYADGVVWHGWHGHYYSLKTTEMKFRPK